MDNPRVLGGVPSDTEESTEGWPFEIYIDQGPSSLGKYTDVLVSPIDTYGVLKGLVWVVLLSAIISCVIVVIMGLAILFS